MDKPDLEIRRSPAAGRLNRPFERLYRCTKLLGAGYKPIGATAALCLFRVGSRTIFEAGFERTQPIPLPFLPHAFLDIFMSGAGMMILMKLL